MLSCTHEESGDVLTINLDLEIALYLSKFPTMVLLPNPIPADSVDSKIGRKLLQQVRKEMDSGTLRVVAYNKLCEHSSARTSQSSSFSSFSGSTASTATRRSNKSLKEPVKKPTRQLNTFNQSWSLDYTEADTRLLQLASDHCNLYLMEDAVRIYSTISHLGKMVLPDLDDNFRKVCRFWLIKKKSGKLRLTQEWFAALTEFVASVCENGFCPSPSKSNLNVSPFPKGHFTTSETATMKLVAQYARDDNGMLLSHATGIYNGYCMDADSSIPE